MRSKQFSSPFKKTHWSLLSLVSGQAQHLEHDGLPFSPSLIFFPSFSELEGFAAFTSDFEPNQDIYLLKKESVCT